MATNKTAPPIHEMSNNGGTVKNSTQTSKKYSWKTQQKDVKQNSSNRLTRGNQINNKSPTTLKEEIGAQGKEITEKTTTRKRFKIHHTKAINIIAAATTMLNTTDNNEEMEDAHLSTKEKIAIQGAATVERITEIVTPVTIEFVIAKNVKVCHIQNSFIHLFTKLQEANSKTRVSVHFFTVK
eukprot:8211189-Ditylum_brightwellii.AAC.1